MDFLTIFALSTIPAGISIMFIMYLREDVNVIMKKENPNFTGCINNTLDLFRMMATYKKSPTLLKAERQKLGFFLLLIGIGFVTVITWIILFLFFPEILDK